jgi:hypothetical protein
MMAKKNNPVGLDSGDSRRSLARLAYSVAARELSDRARSAVATRSDGHAHPGEFLQEALEVQSQTEWLLSRAIALERERGTSWAEIGERLEVSKQAALERYSELEHEWRAALDEPLVPHRANSDVLVCQLPDGADDPMTWAAAR